MATVMVDERSMVLVLRAGELEDGKVYNVPCKLLVLRDGSRALHPQGRLTARGLRVEVVRRAR